MTIETKSSFFYVDEIVLENRFIDYDEGGGEITGEANVGAYTPTGVLNEVARVLTSNGGQDYNVVMNRTSNRVTISALANFDLLVTTGTNTGQSIYGLLGFSTNKTGSNSYTGDLDFSNIYRPQKELQSYVDFEDWREAVQESINESAEGNIEVIKFGQRTFMQANIKWISANWVDAPAFDNDANAIINIRNFLRFATEKRPIEFAKDRNLPDDYLDILLESTTSSSNGTGYKLKELFGQNMAGFHETGILKFRKIGV